MPGKVNPVIPEAVAQVAMAVMGHDLMIVQAASAGNLELSQFLPLVADSFLTMLDLLTHACDIFARQCVAGIVADREHCLLHVHNSTATLTALVERIGYDKAEQLAEQLRQTKGDTTQTLRHVRDRARLAFGDGVRGVDFSRAGHAAWARPMGTAGRARCRQGKGLLAMRG